MLTSWREGGEGYLPVAAFALLFVADYFRQASVLFMDLTPKPLRLKRGLYSIIFCTLHCNTFSTEQGIRLYGKLSRCQMFGL